MTAAIDAWLGHMITADQLDATVEAIMTADAQEASAEPGEVTKARRRRRDLTKQLDRMLAAIRAGMDPKLAASETTKIQRELAIAEVVIADWESSAEAKPPLTENEVRSALRGIDEFAELLEAASREERADLYRALGLRVEYIKEAPTGLESLRARLELSSSGGRI